MPPSPDDDDELERRSKLRTSYEQSRPSPPKSSPVKRLCLWQNHIAQSTNDDSPASKSSASNPSTVSRLNNLNLSHNRFELLPPMLCCLVPYLTSLNLSHNHLTDASAIASYPPRLKTLDLSFNQLQQSILADLASSVARKDKASRRTRHHGPSATAENICFRPELKESHGQLDANKRRRSRSVSRHKVLGSATLSTGVNASNKSDSSDACCSHRRHVRLEFLHDLNLSDNAISELTLSVSRPRS